MGVVPTPKAPWAEAGQLSLKCLFRDRVRSSAKEFLSWLLSTSPVLSSCVALGKSLYLSEPDESSSASKSKVLTPLEELAHRPGSPLPAGELQRGRGDGIYEGIIYCR